MDVGDPAAAGHFTTMQVRGGAVQGLDLHLARLRDATLEMYAIALDERDLRERMRRALDADSADGACTLRVVVRRRVGGAAGLDLGFEIEPPREPGRGPLRLQSRVGLRTCPGLKHLAVGPQLEARRAAQAAGFDDALLVDESGGIAEGTFWNVALWDGHAMAWPDAPGLDGVTQRLLRAALARTGVPQRRGRLSLDALPGMRAAFALNSRGVQAIGSIDGQAFAGDLALEVRLRELLARSAWQRP
jgi:branched-subunit amino acid aminotransferase/4-amino-4-deoxychorismate lyase